MKILRNIENIEKHWKYWPTLKTLSSFSIYCWISNIELNSISMWKIKPLKRYSMSMSMSIFSMFQCETQCSMSICRPLTVRPTNNFWSRYFGIYSLICRRELKSSIFNFTISIRCFKEVHQQFATTWWDVYLKLEVFTRVQGIGRTWHANGPSKKKQLKVYFLKHQAWI